MRRIVSLTLTLLLSTCVGPTPVPAHPVAFAWHLTCPKAVPPIVITPDDPNNYAVDFSELVDFCKIESDAVLCSGHRGATLPLATVLKLDNSFREVFQYRSDFQLYGKQDWWVGYTTCGDCEDYALTMSEILADAGEGGEHMALSLETINGTPHATLLVDTSDAGKYEISVGSRPPFPYAVYDRRDMTITMDGKLVAHPEVGYAIYPMLNTVDRIKN